LRIIIHRIAGINNLAFGSGKASQTEKAERLSDIHIGLLSISGNLEWRTKMKLATKGGGVKFFAEVIGLTLLAHEFSHIRCLSMNGLLCHAGLDPASRRS
jgi:hypothetical protein